MKRKLPSQLLREKLEKIEVSETPKKQKTLTAELFLKLARAAKSTFTDEDLHPTIAI